MGSNVACCSGASCNEGTGHPHVGPTKPVMPLERVYIGLGYDAPLVLLCPKLEMLLHNNPSPKSLNSVEAILGAPLQRQP